MPSTGPATCWWATPWCEPRPTPPKQRSPPKESVSFGGADCRKSIKSVAVGGHAPTTATPTGKFCGKLCARSIATSARFAVKFCRRAAEPSAACGGCSEAEQGQRSQNASAVQGAPHDAGTATRTYTRGNRRVRQSPVSGLRAGPAARLASDTPLRRQCAAVAPFAACRVSRHADSPALAGQRTSKLCRGVFDAHSVQRQVYRLYNYE